MTLLTYFILTIILYIFIIINFLFYRYLTSQNLMLDKEPFVDKFFTIFWISVAQWLAIIILIYCIN
jgi:hypothetical protein